jgi:hypothetical protein
VDEIMKKFEKVIKEERKWEGGWEELTVFMVSAVHWPTNSTHYQKVPVLPSWYLQEPETEISSCLALWRLFRSRGNVEY